MHRAVVRASVISGNDRAETVERVHRTDQDGAVSDTVFEALAAVDREDPRETDYVLYESIDPDALNAVFGSGRRRGTALAFDVGDRRVHLRGVDRGTVRVTVTSHRTGGSRSLET